MTNSINLGGGSYSSTELIQAIQQSNDPTVDLTPVLDKLTVLAALLDSVHQTQVSIESRLHSIENKLASLPTNWSIS